MRAPFLKSCFIEIVMRVKDKPVCCQTHNYADTDVRGLKYVWTEVRVLKFVCLEH
jgi:hypothetical protein